MDPETAFQNPEELYRAIIEGQTDLIIRCTSDWTITFVNDAVSKYYDMPKEGFIGKNLKSLIHGDDHEKVKSIIESLTIGNPIITYEHRVALKDGKVRWLSCSNRATFDKKGNMLEIQVVGRDITDHKNIEAELDKYHGHLEEMVEKRTAALKEANEILENIFKVPYALIAYMDRDLNFIRVNLAFASYSNSAPDYFTGKNFFDIYPDRANEALMRRVVETGQPYMAYAAPFEIAKRAEGETAYWNWSLFPAKDSSGAVKGLILYLVDVTKFKKATDALIKTQRELAETRRLSEVGTLAASIAHELRNPLAVIQTATYNIKRKNKNPALDRNIMNIDAKISESDQIINNLLAYSRIKMPNYEDVKICDIIEGCIADIRERFRNYRVVIVKNFGRCKKSLIKADPVQLSEIFNNVLCNSYEAFPRHKGKVSIKVNPYRKDWINIIFKDNGVGIDKKDKKKIFEPFFTTKSKGTGLGLAVCQQLVRLHGGKMALTSKKSKGTVLTIMLPVNKVPRRWEKKIRIKGKESIYRDTGSG